MSHINFLRETRIIKNKRKKKWNKKKTKVKCSTCLTNCISGTVEKKKNIPPSPVAAPTCTLQLSIVLAICNGGTAMSPVLLATAMQEQTPPVKSLKTDPN